MENVIVENNTIYTNKNGESLSLPEIVKNKKIISVTISYLSKKRMEKLPGLKGFFGSKQSKQDEKKVTITDEKGITFSLFSKNSGFSTIRFWEKNEFQKIYSSDIDEDTLLKGYTLNLTPPYKIGFPTDNLFQIDWE